MAGYTASKKAYREWTPTLTGFSSDPTINASRYSLIGKMCTCYVSMVATTSNANTFTITLPFAAANTAIQTQVVAVVDNGSFQAAAGKIFTRVNSNIADVIKALNSGVNTWTTSGTKACNFTITYEIA